MNKICLIGNSGKRSKANDGQDTKVKLYKKKIEDEGNIVSFVDLDDIKKRPLFVFNEIRRGVKSCNRIVLITAERGIKVLLPFINIINKRHKKPIILPMIGVNILHKYLDKLNEKQHADFMLNKNYYLHPKKKDVKELSKISFILAENEVVANCVKGFYGLSNVRILENFRDFPLKKLLHKKEKNILKLVYFSRVNKEKGILNLLRAVLELQKEGKNIKLDIFGKMLLTGADLLEFNSALSDSITYKGIADAKKSVEILSKYDCFVFPTLFLSEGTPGVISEALIAGTPIISSNFIQSKCILENKKNSFIYNISEKDGLKKAIIKFYNGELNIGVLSNNCYESATRFTYESIRDDFCKVVCGMNAHN